MSRLRIVADAGIPMVSELFASLGEVDCRPGRSIDAAAVVDADILLVRSVTPVDESLLAGSRVRFVGSATIGTDHLDIAWLQRVGVAWCNAPGSNAESVVEYVLAALAALPGQLEELFDGGRVAVVGLGNVGGRLVRRLHALGLRAVACDPLIAPPGDVELLDLASILESSVVCLHTPLTRGGAHPTCHLLDAAALARMPRGALLLNAGRGLVVDSPALAERLAAGALRAVLDVWEEEPEVPADLLEHAALMTPHIAGYSLDGKVAGALMVHAACRRWLGLPALASPPLLPAAPPLLLDPAREPVDLLRQALLGARDVRRDAAALRAVVAAGEGAPGFDRLRREYPPRRGFAAHPVTVAPGRGALSARQCRLLRAAGFLRAGGPAG